MRQKNKSIKPKGTRHTLTKAMTVDNSRVNDQYNKRSGRKRMRRSLDLSMKDYKYKRNRTPKQKNKYLTKMHVNQRQKSSVNISAV